MCMLCFATSVLSTLCATTTASVHLLCTLTCFMSFTPYVYALVITFWHLICSIFRTLCVIFAPFVLVLRLMRTVHLMRTVSPWGCLMHYHWGPAVSPTFVPVTYLCC